MVRNFKCFTVLQNQPFRYCALGRHAKHLPQVAIRGRNLQSMRLSQIFLDTLDRRTISFTQFSDRFSDHLTEISADGYLELTILQAPWIFIRTLALIEDFKHGALLDRDLQVFGHHVFMVVVVLPNCVANPLDAGPLLLRADLPNRV